VASSAMRALTFMGAFARDASEFSGPLRSENAPSICSLAPQRGHRPRCAHKGKRKHWGDVTAAEAMARIGTGKETAGDVRFLKDRANIEQAKQSRIAFQNIAPMERYGRDRSKWPQPPEHDGPEHDGPTIDGEATVVATVPELPAPTTETDTHSEEHCAEMRTKLQSLGIRTK